MHTNTPVRRLICGAFLAVVAALPAAAAPITVGSQSIELPAPAPGFMLVTPDMGQLYELQKTQVVDTNLEFAVFMPEDVATRARDGELSFTSRFMRVQTPKKVEHYDVSLADFAQFTKEAAGQSFQDNFDLAAKSSQTTLDRHSKAVSKAEGADVGLSIGEVKALEAEFPGDRITIIPARMDVIESVNGQTHKRIVSMATALTLVKGKLLFLYVYGGPEDLDWSKRVARSWAADLIAKNPGDVSSTLPRSGALALDWGRILVMGALGGLIALVTSLVTRKRRA
jgi:hypothetical protein